MYNTGDPDGGFDRLNHRNTNLLNYSFYMLNHRECFAFFLPVYHEPEPVDPVTEPVSPVPEPVDPVPEPVEGTGLTS